MKGGSIFSDGYALIIGAGADLPVTIQDAAGLKDILVDPDRCAYLEENIQILTDERATRDSIIAGLDWLADKLKNTESGTAIVYFSGHGGYMPEYHLVPYGYSHADLSNTAISGGEFSAYLSKLNSQKLLVLMDCCHAGGMVDIKSAGYVNSSIPPQVVDILSQGHGKALIASSRKNEFSYTGEPYSLFTSALREALAGYGASDRDGYAYLTDVALYIGRVVPNRTKNRQNPILQISSADNFALAYYAGGDSIPKSLPGAARSPTPFEALDVNMIDGYQHILNKYKQNLLVVEARISEFYDSAAVPLDLERTRDGILRKIDQLEETIEQDALAAGWVPDQ